jgi:hypothetical protein
MSTPQNPQIPESLRIRVGPHGDPPSWLISRLSPEQLVQVYRLQLEYEKAVHAAQGKLLDGLTSAVK